MKTLSQPTSRVNHQLRHTFSHFEPKEKRETPFRLKTARRRIEKFQILNQITPRMIIQIRKVVITVPFSFSYTILIRHNAHLVLKIITMDHPQNIHLPPSTMTARMSVSHDEDSRRSRKFRTFWRDGKSIFRAGFASKEPFFSFKHTDTIASARFNEQCFNKRMKRRPRHRLWPFPPLFSLTELIAFDTRQSIGQRESHKYEQGDLMFIRFIDLVSEVAKTKGNRQA